MKLRGTGAAPGVGVGPALLLERSAAPVFRLRLAAGGEEREVERLEVALARSREQLAAIKERLSREIGETHAYIFDAQLLMLDDALLRERVAEVIRQQRVNAEWALRSVADTLQSLFESFADDYIRERRTDLDDVVGRIQLNLAGAEGAPSLARLPEDVVLVAAELTPSRAAQLQWERVAAVVADVGSPTHHAVILARSLGVPAVVGIEDATRRIAPGATVVVDGTHGEVIVDPSEDALREGLAARQRDRDERRRSLDTRSLAAVTRDGALVRLQANVEFPSEAETALRYGAEGIGLFRTEYLLGRYARWPSEQEQVDVYRRLLEQMRPGSVTVRTWDVGPEELSPMGPSSPNPALGQRALRLLARDREPFLTQLRALLRVGAEGPLRIVLPFIGGPAELDEALALVAEARASLERDGLPCGSGVPVGLNIEVPSAAVTADLLARRADFFSVGTNDLIQYLLAVDRADPRVARHYQPLHPAVLRTLDAVARSAERAGIGLALCGEMASDPLQALLLIGLGFRELSMNPGAIPRVKAVVWAAGVAAARAAAERCLGLDDAAQVAEVAEGELAAALRPAAAFME